MICTVPGLNELSHRNTELYGSYKGTFSLIVSLAHLIIVKVDKRFGSIHKYALFGND